MNDCTLPSLCMNEVETKVTMPENSINFYSLVNIACYNPLHKDYPRQGNNVGGVEFLEKFLGANLKNASI